MRSRNRVISVSLVAVVLLALLAVAPAVLGAFAPEVFAVDQPVGQHGVPLAISA